MSCIYNGVLPYVGFRYDQGERLYIVPYEQQPITKSMQESTKPADIQACLKAAVLPKAYEHTNLSLEIHSEYEIGCFHRGLDKKTVTCPMGFTLKKVRERERGMEYACKPACRQCTNRCTPSKGHKVVLFGLGTEYVAARMYGKQKPVITQPPITVMLRVSDDKGRQRKRLCVSEHPFGTVKWNLLLGRFLLF